MESQNLSCTQGESCSSGVTAITNEQVLTAIRNWEVRGFSTPVCCQAFSDSGLLFVGYSRRGKAHLLTLHPPCTLLPRGMCCGGNIQGAGVPPPLPAAPKLDAVQPCALQPGGPQRRGHPGSPAPVTWPALKHREHRPLQAVFLGAGPSTPPLPLRGHLPERCAREGPGRQWSLLTHELLKVRSPDYLFSAVWGWPRAVSGVGSFCFARSLPAPLPFRSSAPMVAS